jgi:peptidoglycan/LPS O-acetylase OafA/YrhL
MLDLIRALSAQAVLIGHCISMLGIFPQLQPPDAPYMQNLGVAVFFLLSGLLIFYTVDRKSAAEDYSFRKFAIDRFSRIYSGYLPSLVLIAVVDGISVTIAPKDYQHYAAYNPSTFVANVLMLQDYPLFSWLSGSSLGVLSWIPSFTSFGSARPLWTLAIEWWIYLLFGWVVLAKDTLRARPIMFLAVVVALAPVPLWNAVAGRGNGLTWIWLFGGAIYLGLRDGLGAKTCAKVGPLLAGMFIVLAGWRFWIIRQEYDLILGLFIACSLFCILSWSQSAKWRCPVVFDRVIRLAAGYSLTLYCIHYSVAVFLFPRLECISPTKSFVLVFVACNLIALILALPTEMQHRKFAQVLRRCLT